MAIKAVFLSEKKDATTESLYQWDYGQELEIEFKDLGSLPCEVHFACNGMSETIVRPCTLSAGIGGVTIPNECLEQPSTITAWIYEKGADDNRPHGRTRGVITIPVVARMRPGVVRDIPPETIDQYTLLITEIRDAVDEIENGVVKAKYAKEADTAKEATHAGNAAEADTAKEATHAGNASTANYAVSANNASTANYAVSANKATYATYDDEEQPLKDLLRGSYNGFTKYTEGFELLGGFMAFRVIDDTMEVHILTEVGGRLNDCYSPVFYWETNGAHCPARLKFTPVGGGSGHIVTAEIYTNGTWLGEEGFSSVSPTIYYQRLSSKYPVG